MKKLLLLVLFINSFFSFGQNSLVAKKPLFNGVSGNLPEKYKLQDLKFKTQDFISKNLDQAFVKKFLPVGDTIEFNIQYTIKKDGFVSPEDIFVNTEVDFFNLKIKSVLVKLLKFTPAIGVGPGRNIDYTLNFTPEFYVNPLNKIIPVYRYDFPNVSIDIYDDETELYELAKKLGYGPISKNKITNVVHFRTDDSLKIIDFRFFTEEKLFRNKIRSFLIDLKDNHQELYNQLKANTNYVTFVYMILKKTQPKPTGNEVVAIFPGCEDEVDNDSRKNCMNEKINKHIYKNFRSLSLKNMPSGKYQIRIFYKIDENGDIVDIKIRAPHPLLEKETKRVINLIPKMIAPNYQEDKPISVPYYLPVKFVIEKGRIKQESNFTRNNFYPYDRN